MQIAYIGNYYDQTGWGNAALNNILAMDRVGIDVRPIPIRYNNLNYKEAPQRIFELEEKNGNCDTVIIHTLPHRMTRLGDRRHIGYTVYDGDNLGNSGWGQYCSIMDEIWTASNFCQHVYPNSKVVPHCIDVEKYKNFSFKLTELEPYLNNKFVFYFIGEFIARKNLEALLIAYHSVFKKYDKVALVIKTSVPGKSAEESAQIVNNFCAQVKQKMKLYANMNMYQQEYVITNHLNNDGLMALHNTCDCLVIPSKVDGFCIPIIEAMTVGKPSITNACWSNFDSSIKIEYQLNRHYNNTDTFFDIGSSREFCGDINIVKLGYKMRLLYQERDYYEELSKKAKEESFKYSYETIGSTIKELI